MNSLIYLDNGATTPPDPEIVSGIAERASRFYGNPGSGHRLGQEARTLLDASRARLADAFGGRSQDVVLTGGGTEALGLAILGSAGDRPGRIAISAVEHSAVKQAAQRLHERFGWSVDTIPVDAEGRVDAEGLRKTMTADTRIVATMLVNNEIGSINDIPAISKIVHDISPRARLVVDAVQGFGKMPFSVRTLGADCIAVAAHKIHGPKGCGALWSRHSIRPILKGGGQESGRRGGTQSVSMAWALAEAYERQSASHREVKSLRDRLWAGIQSAFPGAALTGSPIGPWRVENHLHLCIPGIPGEPLINALSNVNLCASGGSACSTGKFSAVLTALGRQPTEGAFVRLTVGRFNTLPEMDIAVQRMAKVVGELRSVYA
jgi:cysteine desulfurase